MLWGCVRRARARAGPGQGARGSFFDRLQAVADLRYDDNAEEAAYQVVLDKIGEREDLVRDYAQNNGYRGQDVRAAINEWAQAFAADLGATRDQLRDGHDAVVQARAVMRQARDLFNENVSEELLTGAERGWRAASDVATTAGAFTIPVVGVIAMVATDVYWSGLEKERNRGRVRLSVYPLDLKGSIRDD